MPMVDMSLKDLKKYMGGSPKPDDFDIFWDKSINEMKELGTECILKKADFDVPYAECYDLWFTGSKGSRIYAKFLKPKKIEGKCPAIIEYHGYTHNSGDWVSKLAYVAMGYCFAALDCRGQSGKSEDTSPVLGSSLMGHIVKGVFDSPDNLYYRNTFLDAAQLIRIVMNMEFVDEDRIGVTGWSQGGGLAVAAAALEPKVKKMISGYPFLSDYKRVWEMDLARNAYVGIYDHFRRYDAMHEREDEFFYKLGYIDIQNLAPRVKAETLFFTGLMDTICPPSTQFAAYNKITAKKDMKIFPDLGHEALTGSGDISFEFFKNL